MHRRRRRVDAEEEAAKVRCALVRQRAGHCNQSTHSVRLHDGSGDGRDVGCCSDTGLAFPILRALVLLHGLVPDLAKQGAVHDEAGRVRVEGADSEGAWFDGWEVFQRHCVWMRGMSVVKGKWWLGGGGES